MQHARKITVSLPKPLVKKALQASGENLTETIRKGLELIATHQAFEALRKLKGKVRFSLDLKNLRND
jgi:hypothetical protein